MYRRKDNGTFLTKDNKNDYAVRISSYVDTQAYEGDNPLPFKQVRDTHELPVYSIVSAIHDWDIRQVIIYYTMMLTFYEAIEGIDQQYELELRAECAKFKRYLDALNTFIEESNEEIYEIS